MNRRIMIVLIIFICLSKLNIAMPQPWTDPEQFKINFSATDSDCWLNIMPEVNSIYAKRFGAFPHIMLQKDDSEPMKVAWGVFYSISRKDYEKEIPWTKPIQWKDVQEYFFLKVRNTSNQSVSYYPITMGNKSDTLDYDSYYGTGWSYRLSVDPWKLPLDENIAYEIYPQVWHGTPENGKLIASAKQSVNVVLATHSDPLDNYMDGYFGNKFEGNPDLCVNLLNEFPFNYTLLSHLIYHYKDNATCDSLKWATSQMIYTLENRKDPFYIDKNAVGRPDKTDERITFLPGEREKYIEYVQEVCGDTLLPPPWRTK